MNTIELLLTGVVIGVYAVIWFDRWHYRTREKNNYRYDMARHYYGKDWIKAMRECDEAHLHGTCVLCGGESL